MKQKLEISNSGQVTGVGKSLSERIRALAEREPKDTIDPHVYVYWTDYYRLRELALLAGKLADWVLKNHEMPNYSELVAEAFELVAKLEGVE